MKIPRITRVAPLTAQPATRIKAPLDARDGSTASIPPWDERRRTPLTHFLHRVPAGAAELRAPGARDLGRFERPIRFADGAQYPMKDLDGAARGPTPVVVERMRSSCGGH
jgi:hypothetical protein